MKIENFAVMFGVLQPPFLTTSLVQARIVQSNNPGSYVVGLEENGCSLVDETQVFLGNSQQAADHRAAWEYYLVSVQYPLDGLINQDIRLQDGRTIQGTVRYIVDDAGFVFYDCLCIPVVFVEPACLWVGFSGQPLQVAAEAACNSEDYQGRKYVE